LGLNLRLRVLSVACQEPGRRTRIESDLALTTRSRRTDVSPLFAGGARIRDQRIRFSRFSLRETGYFSVL